MHVFGVGFGDVSPYICTDCFSSVLVAEWPHFGKELPVRLTLCSLCIISICNSSHFPFWFLGQNLGSDSPSSWPLLTCCF